MTRVKCRRRDCVHWENGVCARDLITVDEEEGCVNFEEVADLLDDDEDLDWESDEETPKELHWNDQPPKWVDEDDDQDDDEEEEQDELDEEEEEVAPHAWDD